MVKGLILMQMTTTTTLSRTENSVVLTWTIYGQEYPIYRLFISSVLGRNASMPSKPKESIVELELV
jgi:hypothetical protein